MNPNLTAIEQPMCLTGIKTLAILTGSDLFGHERGNIEVYKLLRDAGAVVHVSIPLRNKGTATDDYLKNLGFDVSYMHFGYPFSWIFVKRHWWLPFYNLYCLLLITLELLFCFARIRFSFALVGNATAGMYCLPAFSIFRLPMIYRAGDRPPDSGKVSTLIYRLSIRYASKIVVISKFVEQLINSTVPGVSGRITRIYNYVPAIMDQVEPRNSHSRRILYMGQIIPQKGIELFIEAAIEILGNHRAGVVFDIVGGHRKPCSYELGLRKKVDDLGLQNSILFHGFQEDVVPFLKSASIHVAPTLSGEPLGSVVLEAKSAGVPSVVVNKGGLPEMVDHLKDGYVCDELSSVAIAKAIRFLLEDPVALQIMGEKAFESSKERFGQSRFIASWLDVVTRQCSTKPTETFNHAPSD